MRLQVEEHPLEAVLRQGKVAAYQAEDRLAQGGQRPASRLRNATLAVARLCFTQKHKD